MDRIAPARDTRILRDRHLAHSAAIDRADFAQPNGSARMVVQVYDGGSIPTVSERVFFTHPVLATGSETEGTAATLTVDSDTTVPVVVLGKPPSVGDYLTAYLCGGRWVTELLTVSGPQCYVATCAVCGIPKGNLTLALTDGTILTCIDTTPYTPATLTWNGISKWEFFGTPGCFGGLGAPHYRFTCNAGSPLLVDFSLTGTHQNFNIVGAHTCSPFSLELKNDAGGSITITGPNTSFGACPVCFHVQGCGNRPISGTTVSILAGMVQVATGTTNSGGNVILDAGSPGTYTVTAHDPSGRFDDFSQSMPLACGVAATSISLVVASGYHCSCLNTPYPMKDALTFSSSAGGATLTWSATNPTTCGSAVLTAWFSPEGAGTFTFPAGAPVAGCPTQTATGHFTWGQLVDFLCSPGLFYNTIESTNCANECPGGPGPCCGGVAPWGFFVTSGTIFPLNLTWTTAVGTATLTE